MNSPHHTSAKASLGEVLADIHQTLLADRGGKVASYIPELARVDPDPFGIAMVAIDGRSAAVGDVDKPFTIQSASKPFVYGMAIEEHGREGVLAKIGVQPVEEAFNAIARTDFLGAFCQFGYLCINRAATSFPTPAGPEISSRLPVIAAVQGACIGGGIDLICACDIRIATTDAQFSIEEINIGMTADVGTLQRLPKLIPPGLVMELALTGRRFSAREAAGWGLINAVHEDAGTATTAAFAMAHEIAAKSPLAIAGIKNAVTYARDHGVGDALDQVATWNAGMLRGEDLMAALQARMARKTARFADLIGAE